MTTYYMGMVGLGVMGGNLARNLASRGFSVAGYDLAEDKRRAFQKHAKEGRMAHGAERLNYEVIARYSFRRAAHILF